MSYRQNTFIGISMTEYLSLLCRGPYKGSVHIYKSLGSVEDILKVLGLWKALKGIQSAEDLNVFGL